MIGIRDNEFKRKLWQQVDSYDDDLRGTVDEVRAARKADRQKARAEIHRRIHSDE